MLELIQYGIILGLALINLITLTLLTFIRSDHKQTLILLDKKNLLVDHYEVVLECRNDEIKDKNFQIQRLEQKHEVLIKILDLNQEINNYLNQLNNEQK